MLLHTILSIFPRRHTSGVFYSRRGRQGLEPGGEGEGGGGVKVLRSPARQVTFGLGERHSGPQNGERAKEVASGEGVLHAML